MKEIVAAVLAAVAAALAAVGAIWVEPMGIGTGAVAAFTAVISKYPPAEPNKR